LGNSPNIQKAGKLKSSRIEPLTFPDLLFLCKWVPTCYARKNSVLPFGVGFWEGSRGGYPNPMFLYISRKDKNTENGKRQK